MKNNTLKKWECKFRKIIDLWKKKDAFLSYLFISYTEVPLK